MGICFIVMSQLYRKSPSSSVFSSTSWSSINIHQPQQNLSCEKDNNKIKKKCSWTKHLHLEMKNKSCVHFDNNIQIKAVCNFVAAGTKKKEP